MTRNCFSATGIHLARFADLVFPVQKIIGDKRPGIKEPLRVAAAGLTLAAPTEDALAGRAEALEEDVAVLVWKIEIPRLLRSVRTEVHVPAVIEVKELQRVDQRRFTGVIWADNLQRARQLHFGVFITARADENESLRASGHNYAFVTVGAARLRLSAAEGS